MILFAYILAISLMIVLPIVLAALARRRLGAPWWLFCVGMATFVISQIYHLPLNDWLTDLGVLKQPTPDSPLSIQTVLLLGLSAGVCESLARAAGYWLLFRATSTRSTNSQSLSNSASLRRWDSAVMVGLGHGGIEAMIFAVIMAASITSLWQVRGQDLSLLNLPAGQLAVLKQQLDAFLSSPFQAILPLIERFIAMLVHVTLSVAVWLAFKRRNPLYFVAAVLYHSTVDALAVYLAQSITSAWAIEGILFALALPGLAWAWWQGRETRQSVRPVMAWPAEWKLFGLSFGKEMIQQWRSRRALVVGVVFLIFGMGSPLLAKFTPEILRAVPGAEQFSGLIPTPTTADSMAQYIKNITQFGFILAVLLGMGAVAGEKERGTTALIMSKPLPRWAFILSKFVAQAVVYGLAFALAALGAFYYTSVLFDPFKFGPFMFGNLLLWVWMLTFAAVTLLGSAIANSTGVAAGIGFGGAVVLLLAGAIPLYGTLAPAGLVGWASTLGLNMSIAANGGALAAGVVWIVVCLIVSVAVFETQEL
ncbi:MAG: YhfC family intramembrane metalloprotease [Anaerolineae bacterium]|nr:YhfC family intramembrane metalloprotease [Anaerolineae bacterium]